MADEANPVPIVAPNISAAEFAAGEDPRHVRERLIAQLSKRFPELVDEFALGSFTGDHTTIIVGVHPDHAEAAPIIGQIYDLLHYEMRKYPDRFPPKPRK